ncbi:MAG: glycoside hydrolase family 2 [Clostridia bacterium]|nr:glycoside hydrolase family 2 [Clostridia bacterium]
MRIDLNGNWKLYFFHCEERISELSELEKKPSVPAVVPGNVELDLQRAGLLPDDLFFGDNLQAIRKYELYDWCYEREFEAEIPGGERAELVFSAVDCIADYYLNGELIGSSDNMFIEHRFDVAGKLKSKNTLHVYIKSAVDEGIKMPVEAGMSAQAYQYEALGVRKAISSYGWDIFCRAVSAGIWRPVYIETLKRERIEDIHFETMSVSSTEAKMRVAFNFDVLPSSLWSFDESSGKYKKLWCELDFACGEHKFTYVNECNSSRGVMRFSISNPKLWYPMYYGEQALYTVTARLYRGDGTQIDTRNFRIGIRVVELESSATAGADGKFVIKINGVPIMCKGSNWVPLDPFHSRDRDKVKEALDLFVESHSNIVRCWGGNVYEDTEFFDICDEKGIMVWQDFAMACGAYPQDAGFCEKIRVEAESVIKKLRRHPSLVIWCGDNECDTVYTGNKLGDPNNNVLTRSVLPEVLHIFDPFRPYIPSSPYISPEIYEDYRRSGSYDLCPEGHLWGPRNYFKNPIYTESPVHFISEMGYHGCNCTESIKKFIPEDHLWRGGDIAMDKYWLYHATCVEYEKSFDSYRIKLMLDQAYAYFGKKPGSLEEFSLMSQITQAEAKKYFVERMRIKKWYTSGIIWWNMLDGWPQLSDAVVDYYGAKKLAFEYIRRSQTKVCIMIDEPRSWWTNVVLSNDSLEEFDVTYEVTDADDGSVVLAGETHIDKNINKVIGKLNVSTGDHKMFVIKYTYGDVTEYNHYVLGYPPFDLERYKKWLAVLAQTDKKLTKWVK